MVTRRVTKVFPEVVVGEVEREQTDEEQYVSAQSTSSESEEENSRSEGPENFEEMMCEWKPPLSWRDDQEFEGDQLAGFAQVENCATYWDESALSTGTSASRCCFGGMDSGQGKSSRFNDQVG